MKKPSGTSEYSFPGEEYSIPPDSKETLSDSRRFFAVSDNRPVQRETGAADNVPTLSLPSGEAQEENADAKHAASRKAARKRSLLLQFAAVASSVVLVTNSFGLDLLGLDGLFNDSVITGKVSQETVPYDQDPESPTRPDPATPTEPASQLFGGRLPFGGDAEFPVPSNGRTVTRESGIIPETPFIAAVDYAEDGGLGRQAAVTGFLYVDPSVKGSLFAPSAMNYSDPQSNMLTSDAIRYDRASNTLTLHDYTGKGLLINCMGQDFKICLEGDNILSEYLLVGSGSLTLTGEGGILINEDREFDYGICLAAQYSDAALMLEQHCRYNVSGRVSVFAVTATNSQKPMWQLSGASFGSIIQGYYLQQEDLSPVPADHEHYHTWLLKAEDGTELNDVATISTGYFPHGEPGFVDPTESRTGSEPVIETQPQTDAEPGTETLLPSEEVPPTEPEDDDPSEPKAVMRPLGGDSAYPRGLVTATPDSEARARIAVFDSTVTRSYINDGSSGIPDCGSFSLAGMSYDAASNTLTLDNYQGDGLQIEPYGSSFTIVLKGKNKLQYDLAVVGGTRVDSGGSVRFTGDGSLLLNTSREQEYGLRLDVFDMTAQACVMIDAGVTLEIYGTRCAARVTGQPNLNVKGFYYLGSQLDTMQQGIRNPSSEGYPQGFCNWYIVDSDRRLAKHVLIGTETPYDAVVTGLPIGGDSTFPILPNPMPNTTVPGYGTLNEDYIITYDSETDTTDYIYVNSTLAGMAHLETVTKEGISYDPNTNTLTLRNYRGDSLYANLMGNSFTVRLIGENELSGMLSVWGFYTGGSVRFTGSGSLALNTSKEQPLGLELHCEYSASCVMIEKDVTLDIYGNVSPVNIANTNAEKAFWYLSEEAVPAVRQYNVQTNVPDNEAIPEEAYYTWMILDDSPWPAPCSYLHIGK